MRRPEIPDLTGKTAIVTGANSGIGFETAAALASAGAAVTITARNPEKGTAALSRLKQRSGGSVELCVFDLGSLASVRRGAAQLLEHCERIDILVNNAGLVLSERQTTPDGFEATFAINHLGPFLLTNLLLHKVIDSAPARIVNVASTAHRSAWRGIDFDDLNGERRYRGMDAYAKSKLANILFTRELARRLGGTGVDVNAVHPGVVATGYGRDGDTKGVLAFGVKLIGPIVKTPEEGARCSLWVATAPELAGVSGQYFVNGRVKRPTSHGRDDDAARRLWEVSEKLVGRIPPTP